ncbi:MAG: hypothetical protein P4L51_12525 [Puia sp.]|nr:hypothetical protein [Puia sp.]
MATRFSNKFLYVFLLPAYVLLSPGVSVAAGGAELPPGKSKVPGKSGNIVLQTDYMRIELDGSGNMIHLFDKAGGADYMPDGHVSPLLSLYKDSVYSKPRSVSYLAGHKKLRLAYENGSVAIVSVGAKGGYLRFELLSVEPRQGVQAVVWGPYGTRIRQSIGETICVVHDEKFAVGMQALDINTIEGLPEGNDNAGGGSFIDPLPGQKLPDSLKGSVGLEVPVNVNVTGDMPEYVRMYRGSAAVKKTYGSELRLFSRDRRLARVVENGNASSKGTNLQYVAPIDVDFTGSAIAFFGCPEPKVLDIIGAVEVAEKLPHPMLDGEWIKRSKIPGQAYLMFEGKDIRKGIEYADRCGFKLIHAGDLFHSWGHFGLETSRYPGGARDIRKVTTLAGQSGIALGVHTLTMFTGTDDPYIAPIPSDSLAEAGTTVLSKELGENDVLVYIKDPVYFRNLTGTHTVKIGKELIGYRGISPEAPWHLLDCRRGQFRTLKAVHPAGSRVAKLINNDYQGFYPDIHLQDAYSKRLAAVCNETGLGLMDFDGFGGESPTGEGTYGAAKFVDLWYRSLDRYVLTCGAGTFHYYWHIYSFMNWGEPWYNALRQSQVNYRIENQRYFDRNYMPHMLGWFSLGVDYRPEEIEWIQARSAAFNAGYLLRVDESIEKNGFKDEIFTAVTEWQKARNAGAFSVDQIEKFKDPKSEFHLQRTGPNQWQLYPVSLQTGYGHKFRKTQTGEPVTNRFSITNPYGVQPVRFYITAKATDGNSTETLSNLRISINNYQDLEIGDPIRAGDKLILDGKTLYFCDAYWKKLKEIRVNAIPNWAEGTNEIVVTSDFSGEQSPMLTFDFESVGKPEQVAGKP